MDLFDGAVCRFCGGNKFAFDHERRCDGRQGHVEATPLAPFVAREHVRTTDPDTSVAAAFAVADATEVQQRVIALYKQHPEGMTDEELIEAYQRTYRRGGSRESAASPRKRRSDLTRFGVLLDSGERRMLASGRRGVVWKVA